MRLSVILFLCPVFLLLAGWGHWGPQVKTGVSLDRTEGRQALVKDLKDQLAENRADFLLKDAKGDAAAQESQVQDLIAQGIQALLLLPTDPSKAAPLVAAAHQAGLKAISLERLIPDSELDYMVSFNPEKEGELQALAMVKRVPRGNYVLLGKDLDFRKGQMKVLEPLIAKGELQILASHSSTATPAQAEKEMKAILKAQGNKLDAVLASDSDLAQGAVQALEKAGLSGKTQVGGVGEDLATCRRIAAGTQALTVYHPPQKLAEEAAYLAAKVARKAKQFDCQFTDLENGKGTTKAVLLTPAVVDAQNLDSTIVKDGVQKREEVYGGKP